MQIASRFTIAVHILTCIEVFRDEGPCTSESIAGSVGVNPVVIRRVLGQLKDAGMVRIVRGVQGGAV
ncbi:MAG: Rrf2 family transcriptional regulator, partial [Firmicutes bacterium]|nr:Rrf2 family transcriptional regulator [Bacillota bacterium]